MVKTSALLYRISRGWVAWFAFLVFIVFSALTLPEQNELADSYSQGRGSPDTSLFYSGEELYSLAEVYGEAGRAAYLKARWTFDLAFPFVYSFFLITSISWTLNRLIPSGSRWRLLNLIPLAAFAFDLLENSAASLVMARYPIHSPPGELLAPIFTPVKWLAVGGSFVLLLVGLIYWGLKRLKLK